MSERHRAFLALGSNIGDRVGHLRRAIASIPDVDGESAVYETPPISEIAQDAFLNMVVRLDTELDARALLDVCRACEAEAQRVRIDHWGPRTLDVDVLWVDGETVDDPPDLLVPHPRMFERSFVLVPLADLGADLLPDGYDVEATAAADGIVRVGRLDELEAEPTVLRTHIVGGGRAGGALAAALTRAGWPEPTIFGRDADRSTVGADADLVVIATPDDAIADVAAALPRRADVAVAHLAGSLGLDVLGDHPRVAAIHPLVSMPDAETGAARLPGAWFAIAGDPRVQQIVAALEGQAFHVADADRAAYHAAAVVASNHLVALLGHAERIAATAGVPFDAFLQLIRGSVENVAALGPAAALTGPAARGDEATIERHLAALPEDERASYEAMAREARRLAGRSASDAEGAS
ncbi:MAG: 2-amino-4-hydroxy-6-hydroxymethyldihydropteridine diphosphokinase [Acidimicrobiales bacterium]|nr:2-amino-4-hydroxy-6-hydroxymethyldihydropteridine diphosphokinase [Acidimicrobiales bacterium]